MTTLTAESLRAQFAYNAETGVFTRLARARDEFKCDRDWAAWNAKFAGDIAGTASSQGYRYIKIKQKRFAEHRLAWMYVYGEFPRGEIDHINGNRSDNRLTNLRVVTRAENCRNLARRSDNTSGHIGVSWNKAMSKWAARIAVGGKHRALGLFVNLADAISARKAAERDIGFHANHGMR